MKTCSKCHKDKSLKEFFKDKRKKDGHQITCKACQLKRAKEYRQTDKGRAVHLRCYKRYRLRHADRIKEKRYAQNAVNRAIAKGQLQRPDTQKCHYCPEAAEQYHHHKGYEPEHWLDVEPTCRKCHTRIHNNLIRSSGAA